MNRGYPRADHYDIWFCDSPTCGMHLVSYDKDNNTICETVTSRDQTLNVIAICQAELYRKTANDD